MQDQHVDRPGVEAQRCVELTGTIDVLVLHGSQGYLVLRLVSRLDAFSGYLVHT